MGTASWVDTQVFEKYIRLADEFLFRGYVLYLALDHKVDALHLFVLARRVHSGHMLKYQNSRRGLYAPP